MAAFGSAVVVTLNVSLALRSLRRFSRLGKVLRPTHRVGLGVASRLCHFGSSEKQAQVYEIINSKPPNIPPTPRLIFCGCWSSLYDCVRANTSIAEATSTSEKKLPAMFALGQRLGQCNVLSDNLPSDDVVMTA